MPRRIVWLAALGLGAASVALGVAAPLLGRGIEPIDQTWNGVAIEGTDAVAYFTDGRPVAGSKAFELEWNGATWRFASAAHRDQFRADPERFAPQYGGYCAWAVGHGRTAKIDPEAWAIVNGRLYLNYDRDVQAKWLPAKEQWIDAADRNWPRLRDGKQP